MEMTRSLAWVAGIGIVALVGADAWLVCNGQGGAKTVVELCVGGAGLVSAGVAWAVHGIRRWKARRASAGESPAWAEESEVDSLRDSVDSLEESVGSLRDEVDSLRTGDEPDVWVAVVNLPGDDGKLYEAYRMAPEDTREEAMEAARGSLMSREAEGLPSEGAVVTFERGWRP